MGILLDKSSRSCKEKFLTGFLRTSIGSIHDKQQTREALWEMILAFLEDKPPTKTTEGEETALEASAFSWVNSPERDGNVLTTMSVLI